MHELYELKETLLDELEQFAQKGDISAKDLEVVDKLTHTVKNLCKIIDEYEKEDGYSMARGTRGGSYESMDMTNRSMASGSYARGRRGGRTGANQYGSYAQGYSRNENMMDQLQELMQNAPDEHTRKDIQRIISRMENM